MKETNIRVDAYKQRKNKPADRKFKSRSRISVFMDIDYKLIYKKHGTPFIGTGSPYVFCGKFSL